MGEALFASSILSVGDLTEKLKKSLERDFPFVWVKGEVTNLGKSGSGHLYFSLKDSKAQLNCVWFRQNQIHSNAGNTFDPMTGEVFPLARPSLSENLSNGIEILCAGRIGIYTMRGQYQLIVEIAEYAGEGKLAFALEERKQRLAAKGYFATARKKKILSNPRKVVLITSTYGAAIHDFIELANSRGYSSKIVLYPVAVQGEEAPGQIINALEQANLAGWGEVIVIIRGGGSLEDLWAFNDEALAEAVYKSKIPVVSGIGHEIDVCLVDLVADLRAATPSHAAQLLWTSRTELCQQIDDIDKLLSAVLCKYIANIKHDYEILTKNLHVFSPIQKLNNHKEKLFQYISDLDNIIKRLINDKFLNLVNLDSLIRNKKFVNHEYFFEKITNLQLILNNIIIDIIKSRIDIFDHLKIKLFDFINNSIEHKQIFLNSLDKQLFILDPEYNLNKCCAHVLLNHKVIISIHELHLGDKINIIFDGSVITATIDEIKPKEDEN